MKLGLGLDRAVSLDAVVDGDGRDGADSEDSPSSRVAGVDVPAPLVVSMLAR